MFETLIGALIGILIAHSLLVRSLELDREILDNVLDSRDIFWP